MLCSTVMKIRESLCMNNCGMVVKIPNRTNSKFSVNLKPDELVDIVTPLVEDIKTNRHFSSKTIIFCCSYDECTMMFQTLAEALGDEDCLFLHDSDGSLTTVCDIFSAATETNKKDKILHAFTTCNMPLRIAWDWMLPMLERSFIGGPQEILKLMYRKEDAVEGMEIMLRQSYIILEETSVGILHLLIVLKRIVKVRIGAEERY